eukprot:COSAG01_NODE_654_length_14482_cov_20.826347_11_plen_79_part_00
MGLTNIDDAYVLEESDKAKLRDIVRRCRPALAPATAHHGREAAVPGPRLRHLPEIRSPGVTYFMIRIDAVTEIPLRFC